MGLLNGLAKFAGESIRIKRTADQAEQLDPQTKQWLNMLIENAQNGNVDSMFELGCCYFQGQYVVIILTKHVSGGQKLQPEVMSVRSTILGCFIMAVFLPCFMMKIWQAAGFKQLPIMEIKKPIICCKSIISTVISEINGLGSKRNATVISGGMIFDIGG